MSPVLYGAMLSLVVNGVALSLTPRPLFRCELDERGRHVLVHREDPSFRVVLTSHPGYGPTHVSDVAAVLTRIYTARPLERGTGA